MSSIDCPTIELEPGDAVWVIRKDLHSSVHYRLPDDPSATSHHIPFITLTGLEQRLRADKKWKEDFLNWLDTYSNQILHPLEKKLRRNRR